MAWCLIRFGYLGDPRLQKAINWITSYQRFDDIVKDKPTGWPYDKRDSCWGRHTCHYGTIKTLKALAEIPPGRRAKKVRDTINQGVEYFLKHHIYKRSHNLERIAKPIWLKLGFPLMWNTDILEILGIMLKLEARDKRINDAVDIISSKRNQEGRWILENTFNGRTRARIEQKGKPSKWVTLKALSVLTQLFGEKD